MLSRALSGAHMRSHHVRERSFGFACVLQTGLLLNSLRGDMIAVNLHQDRPLQKSYRENKPQTLL